MKKILGALAVVAMITLVAPAQAASVDIDITLGSVTILHYYPNIDVTIDSDALVAMLGYTDTEVEQTDDPATATISVSPFTTDLAITPDAPTNDGSAVDLTLQNAWAVRGMGGANDTINVAIAVTDATLAHATSAGDSITISNPRVQSGAEGPLANIDVAAPGFSTTVAGDVILQLDLSAATVSGEYIDGVFTLVATAS